MAVTRPFSPPRLFGFIRSQYQKLRRLHSDGPGQRADRGTALPRSVGGCPPGRTGPCRRIETPGQHADRRAAVGPAAAGRRRHSAGDPDITARNGHRHDPRPTVRRPNETHTNVNSSGRSSDSLPSRRLPDPSRVSGRRYSELTEHHSSGTVRDLHPIPFSFRPPQEERNTRSGDKDSGFPRKRQKAGK